MTVCCNIANFDVSMNEIIKLIQTTFSNQWICRNIPNVFPTYVKNSASVSNLLHLYKTVLLSNKMMIRNKMIELKSNGKKHKKYSNEWEHDYTIDNSDIILRVPDEDIVYDEGSWAG